VVAKMMKKYHVPSIVFSSSATVYGDPEVVPLTEDCKLGETTNPYGATKAMMEKNFNGCAIRKSRNECNFTSLFQSNWSA